MGRSVAILDLRCACTCKQRQMPATPPPCKVHICLLVPNNQLHAFQTPFPSQQHYVQYY